MIIFAFHFNRGAYLRNLIESIERHAPGLPLVIMDDDSDLPDALSVLEELSSRHEIMTPSHDPARRTEGKTGGLQANINRAVEIARSRGHDIALMIQDDQQLVRDIDDEDHALFQRAFEVPGSSFVLQSNFLRADLGRRLDEGAMSLFAPGLYRRMMVDPDRQRAKMFAYSASGVFHTGLFSQQIGRLIPGERNNDRILQAKGLRMNFMADPIMHWLPMPIAFRRRTRRTSARFADWLAGAGVHPITPISRADLDRDRAAVLPIDEDFLTAPTLPKGAGWSIYPGRTNLMSRGGLYRGLARLIPGGF